MHTFLRRWFINKVGLSITGMFLSYRYFLMDAQRSNVIPVRLAVKLMMLGGALMFLSGCSTYTPEPARNSMLFQNPKENALLVGITGEKSGIKFNVVNTSIGGGELLSVPAGKRTIEISTSYWGQGVAAGYAEGSTRFDDLELEAGRIYRFIARGQTVIMSSSFRDRFGMFGEYPVLVGEYTGKGILTGETQDGERWIYRGELLYGYRKGQGVYISSDEVSYEGIFEGDYVLKETRIIAPDTFTGTFTVTYPSGSIYEGQIVVGRFDGIGVLTCANGKVYDGRWRQNRFVEKLADGNSRITLFNQDAVQWVYDGKAKRGRYLSKGRIKYASGDVAEGSFVAERLHGQCTYLFADGSRYEGGALRGKWHGHGTFVWPSGRKYTGQWVENRIEGSGTMTFGDGSFYEGQWKNNTMHGKGRLQLADERVYSGTWANGVFYEIADGFGEGFSYSSSALLWHYEGEFKDKLIHGTGVFTWSDGTRYEGFFSSGVLSGEGRMTMGDGRAFEGNWNGWLCTIGPADAPHAMASFSGNNLLWHYEGEIVDGARNGYGICTYSNGDRYEGEWNANSFHGKGKMTLEDGTVYDGKWHYNRYAYELPEGKSRLLQFSGNNITWTYEGEIIAEMRLHGKGKYFASNGDIFDGKWKEGSLEGFGTADYADGSSYVGEWQDGKFHGSGTLVYKDGAEYTGQWENHKRHGKGKHVSAYHNLYDGDWFEDYLHGLGASYQIDGSAYVGQYVKGTHSGIGRYTWPDGRFYEGDVSDGLLHGHGTMYARNGAVIYRGYWNKGERVKRKPATIALSP